jgi:hypothetical protein
MIPLSGRLKDDLEKKYRKRQNLPKNDTKKPSLIECRSCSQFEEGPDSVGGSVGKVFWCVTKYFDQVKKRPVTCYRNIELMETCPKQDKKSNIGKYF